MASYWLFTALNLSLKLLWSLLPPFSLLLPAPYILPNPPGALLPSFILHSWECLLPGLYLFRANKCSPVWRNLTFPWTPREYPSWPLSISSNCLGPLPSGYSGWFPPNFLFLTLCLRPHGAVQTEHLEFRPGPTYSPVPFFSPLGHFLILCTSMEQPGCPKGLQDSCLPNHPRSRALPLVCLVFLSRNHMTLDQ